MTDQPDFRYGDDASQGSPSNPYGSPSAAEPPSYGAPSAQPTYGYGEPPSGQQGQAYAEPSAGQAGYGYRQQPYPQGQPGYGATPGYGAQQPAYGVQPYPYGGVQQEHPQSQMVFILGIVGIFTGITAFVAWYMGGQAKKEIEAGAPYPWSGQLKTGYTLGKVFGIISIVGWSLMIVIYAAYFIFLFSVIGGMR